MSGRRPLDRPWLGMAVGWSVRVRVAWRTPFRCERDFCRRTRCRCGRCARAGQGNAAILLGPAGPTGRYRTTQVDVAAGHSPERHHLDELDEGQASYGSEGWGFESLRAHWWGASDLRKRDSPVSGRDHVRAGSSMWCCLVLSRFLTHSPTHTIRRRDSTRAEASFLLRPRPWAEA